METLENVNGTDIRDRIILLRGFRVIVDADLAELYGVSKRRLNEQVRRNISRFPPDFMFELSAAEKSKVVANCDDLSQLRYSPTLPLAFTEHGAVMVAAVLNSARAVEVSILVVRAFVEMRQMIGLVSDLAERLDDIESRYDEQFRVVFNAVRALMAEPGEKSEPRRIGFRVED